MAIVLFLKTLLVVSPLGETSPPKGERAVKGSFLAEGNFLIHIVFFLESRRRGQRAEQGEESKRGMVRLKSENFPLGSELHPQDQIGCAPSRGNSDEEKSGCLPQLLGLPQDFPHSCLLSPGGHSSLT